MYTFYITEPITAVLINIIFGFSHITVTTPIKRMILQFVYILTNRLFVTLLLTYNIIFSLYNYLYIYQLNLILVDHLTKIFGWLEQCFRSKNRLFKKIFSILFKINIAIQ